MKKTLIALTLLLAGSTSAFAQTTLASWTFETNPPADLSNSTTIANIVADAGLNAASSFASGVHCDAATDWTTPSGNGSANSLSANTWNLNDYFQFSTSTTGYSGITLAWDQTSSNTGPRDFKLAYSLNGTSFTDVGTYSVLANASPNPAWNGTTSSPLYNLGADLTTIVALDNAASVYFRLIDNSTVSANNGTVASGGTDRVDNFTITTGAVIPEPSTYALTIGLLGLGFAFFRRHA